jgi:hypothetical protein
MSHSGQSAITDSFALPSAQGRLKYAKGKLSLYDILMFLPRSTRPFYDVGGPKTPILLCVGGSLDRIDKRTNSWLLNATTGLAWGVVVMAPDKSEGLVL